MEQMKIEILTPQKMVNAGSSFVRVLQNEHTPILDLFVRESLQNCLDAADGAIGAVKVSFNVGLFNSSALNNTLEGISTKLNKKFPSRSYSFIAISDKGTQGLTGPMQIEDIKEGMPQGNLIKLVYDVGKPQDSEGAGGSWGYGKTIYSRIGIGLVFYYSRIKKNGGGYESRLAGCLAEDENNNNSIIPKYKDKPKYGIAWWGEEVGENRTKPITDETYIKTFLDIFGLPLYEGKDVGTRIIIPYLKVDSLLNDNAKDYSESLDDKKFVPYWRNKIEDYIRVAVQRWYFPRLNNKCYKYGKWLEVDVDGERITDETMLQIFQLYKALYNRAASGSVADNDFIKEKNIECYEEDVKVNKLTERYAGRVAFVQIKSDMIGLTPPHNEYHPNINLGINIIDKTKNTPILAYTRKPGMIVSYEQTGEWVKDIPLTDTDTYRIAIFVLNSDAYFNDLEDLSLEQYVRGGEQSDHISWNDTSKYGINLNTVYRIKLNTAKVIAQHFQDNDEDIEDNSRISGLGRMLGKLILPPTGFGTKPTSRGTRSRSDGGLTKVRDVSFRLDYIKYGKDFILIQYNIAARNTAKQFEVDIDISSKSSPISMQAWEEEMAMKRPFEIIDAILKITKKDGRKSYNSYHVSSVNNACNDEFLSIKLNTTSQNTPYGIYVVFNSQHEYEMDLVIKMNLYKRDICPKINFK